MKTMKRNTQNINVKGRVSREGKIGRWYYIFINKKGQTSALEYAVFVVCIVLALITMQKYVARALQGRMRSTADSIGTQYDPGHTQVDFTTVSSSDTTSNTSVFIHDNNLSTVTIVTTNRDEQTRSGVETVGAF